MLSISPPSSGMQGEWEGQATQKKLMSYKDKIEFMR
jgi:hypothetical protein